MVGFRCLDLIFDVLLLRGQGLNLEFEGADLPLKLLYLFLYKTADVCLRRVAEFFELSLFVTNRVHYLPLHIFKLEVSSLRLFLLVPQLVDLPFGS